MKSVWTPTSRDSKIMTIGGIVFTVLFTVIVGSAIYMAITDPCEYYECGYVETKTSHGERATVKRCWCAQLKAK